MTPVFLSGVVLRRRILGRKLGFFDVAPVSGFGSAARDPATTQLKLHTLDLASDATPWPEHVLVQPAEGVSKRLALTKSKDVKVGCWIAVAGEEVGEIVAVKHLELLAELPKHSSLLAQLLGDLDETPTMARGAKRSAGEEKEPKSSRKRRRNAEKRRRATCPLADQIAKLCVEVRSFLAMQLERAFVLNQAPPTGLPSASATARRRERECRRWIRGGVPPRAAAPRGSRLRHQVPEAAVSAVSPRLPCRGAREDRAQVLPVRAGGVEAAGDASGIGGRHRKTAARLSRERPASTRRPGWAPGLLLGGAATYVHVERALRQRLRSALLGEAGAGVGVVPGAGLRCPAAALLRDK
eukprot:scaffold7099_cov281-Pinguiococcus_pyrenoidosus.AAC.8